MKILVAFRVNLCSFNFEEYNTVELAFVDSGDVHDSKRVIIEPLVDDSDSDGFFPDLVRIFEDCDCEYGKFVPCNFSLSHCWYCIKDWQHSDGEPLSLRQFVESYIDLWRVFDGGFSHD